MLTPSETQKQIVARVAYEPTRAALLNLDTGVGKTPLALWVAEEIQAKTVLIVAPMNTEDGWMRHATEILPDLPFKVIDSKHLDVYQQLRSNEPGVYFITRTYYGLVGTSLTPRRKPDGTWTKGRVQLVDWTKVKPDVMVSDESHEANHRGTTAFKVLTKPKPRFKLALSATPAGNKFDRMWETCRWLWPDLIDRSKNRWAAQWCQFQSNPWKTNGTEIVGEKEPGAFVKTLPCYITGEATGKVPVKTIRVKTPMTGKQREQYESMLRAGIAWLDDNPLVASLPIVKKTRLRQIALGEVSFDENDEVVFADDCVSSKIYACQKIAEMHETVLFYTDSERFARVLAKRVGGEVWSGKVSKANRAKLKARFLSGEVKRLVAVIAAFGTGTDGLQQACSTEVWCNQSFIGVHNKQAEGRLNRTGQTAPEVVRYLLIAPDSGDTDDLSRQALKRRVLDASL